MYNMWACLCISDPPIVIVPEMPYRYVAEHQLSPRAYFLPPVQQAPAPPPPAPAPQPVVIQQPYIPQPLASAPQPHQTGSSWGKGGKSYRIELMYVFIYLFVV